MLTRGPSYAGARILLSVVEARPRFGNASVSQRPPCDCVASLEKL